MEEKEPIKQKKKQPKNAALTLVGAGTQMGVTIFLGSQLGKWLDEKYPSDKNWFTILFVLASVGISLFLLIRQLKSLND